MADWAVVRVRFGASPGFIGGAIRAVTGSLWQHVEFGTPQGTWIGAHWQDGVQERPADYWKTSEEAVYEIPCTPEQAQMLLLWARAKIGTKYNLFDIAGLLIQRREWTTPHRLICSQFVCDGLLDIFGPHRVLNVLGDWTYRVTPEVLHLSPIFVGCRVKKVG